MVDDGEKIEIVVPERVVAVRQTRTLFRLTPECDAGGFARQVAVVAADTEEEARQLASLHDPFRRDWRDPAFAVAEALRTSEDHVFGDVTLRSEPAAPPAPRRADTRGT